MRLIGHLDSGGNEYVRFTRTHSRRMRHAAIAYLARVIARMNGKLGSWDEGDRQAFSTVCMQLGWLQTTGVQYHTNWEERR